MPSITFRTLQPGDAEGLSEAHRIMASEKFTFAFDYEPGQDFAAYLEFLEGCRHGRDVRPGMVASTYEVAVVDGRIAGRLSVRFALTEFLLQQGGHVGYGVLPEFRGRGIGSACLRRGLEITAQRGIDPVLVTCDDDNHVSRRIIEKAGGRYESSYVGADASVPVRRYWIASAAPDASA